LLATGKVPGKNCIPAEVLKCCKILPKIGWPPRFLSILRSLHEDMKSNLAFNGWASYPFDITALNKVASWHRLCSMIFFAVLWKHAFGSTTEDIYLHSRLDGRLFNLDRIRANSKVQRFPLR